MIVGDLLFIEYVERLSMSDCESMPAEVRDRLRSIPAVHELLVEWPVMKAAGDAGDTIVREAIDVELDAERAAIRSGVPARNKRELALAIERRCHRLSLPTLRPAVNATGVVIHTNLGRAPLAPAAVQAVTDVARSYSTLEYDVATCARGGRKEHAARLLRTLTGAQDALVVNNNAAAVLLVLAAHAAGKEVIVSRGELVEVGGSFRIPDIMAASGAKLVEVGSTNRTHLDDYRSAITPNTAMILKVHPSNYRIEGFHEEVSAAELSALAHEHGLLLYEDQGSGALLADGVLADAGEKLTSASLCAGADVVSCSGDKLLGASQAGIILGSARRLPPAPLIRLCARFAPASSRSRRSRPPCAFMWAAPIRHIGRSRCSTCFPARRLRSSVRPSAYTTACCANFASFSARTRWSCRLSRAPLPPAAGRCRLSSSQPFALPSAPSMGAYLPMA